MTGVVVSVGPGTSTVRLSTGPLVVARNGLNVRTPPKARVQVAKTTRGWVVIGRER